MPDKVGYKTIEEAVYAAAHATRSVFNNEEEAITLVYEDGGKFFFTQPGSRDPNSRRVKASFKIPKGSLRYIVHNHPSSQESDLFSNDDITNAERLKIPSAIIFGENPTIRVFVPGTTKTTTFGRNTRGLHQGGTRSKGDPFNYTPPESQEIEDKDKMRLVKAISMATKGGTK